MIERLYSGAFEHPTRNDADYHLQITVARNGEAELHVIADSGGWFEYGRGSEIALSAATLARELSNAGQHVVVSCAWPDPILVPRGRANLRRVA